MAIEFLMGGDQSMRYATKLDPKNYNYYDSLTYANMLKLIDERGFPEMSKHGFGVNEFEAFMLHYSIDSPEKLQEVLNLLEKANDQEIYGKKFAAVVIDRFNMWNAQKPQIYGLWNVWQDREKGNFSPIENIESIDETRFTKNLLRLKEQAEAEALKLPESYKPASYPKNYFCGFAPDLN